MRRPTRFDFSSSGGRRAFTLIELLIVVAIIAILAAIAVPNFLEAQTRSKVARCKADMRTLGTAVECYKVDTNTYPPPYGVSAQGRDSLSVLSTPIAYVAVGKIVDPFASPNLALSKSLLTYEAVSSDNRIIETSSKFGSSWAWVSPTDPEGATVYWWWAAARGPDKVFDGFSGGSIVMEDAFFQSDSEPDKWLSLTYDPTNGTASVGNIYRAGGELTGFAGQSMMR